MTRDEEIAALRARIEQLERAGKPPPAPDLKSFERFDPTANMRMPAEALREMINNPLIDSTMRGAIRDSRAPTGPASMIPEKFSASQRQSVKQSTPRWRPEIPIGPPPGVVQADRLMDAQDAKDRDERMMEEARRRAGTK